MNTRSQSHNNPGARKPELLMTAPLITPLTPPEEEITWIREVMGNDSLEPLSSTESLARMLKFSLNTLFQTQALIQTSTENMKHVERRVDVLETEMRVIDQYSRKDVMILTGLPLHDPDEETEEELASKVLDAFRFVNPSLPMTYKDFSAIHRNGRRGKNGKPPSVTVKFLRLHEKAKFMTREAKRKFKAKDLNVFHALAPRTIAEQDLIKNSESCDYVFYSGPQEHFVVKLKCNHYLKYVKDANDYQNKLINHECD